MAQLEQLANEQLQSCQKYPVPRPKPSDPVDQFVYWVAFDTAIRAEVSILLHNDTPPLAGGAGCSTNISI